MQIISVSTSIVMAIVGVGLLLGFFRGWKRSLIRLASIIASLMIALFVAPSLTASFISSNATGTTLNLFSFTIDFEEIVGGFSGEGLNLSELFAEGSATNELALALMNIVVNLVLFLIIFFVAWFVTLFIYWIVLLIVKIKTRNNEKEEVERNSKYWILKVVSMFIGLVGSFGICFVILTPVFGVMDVCDGFLVEASTDEESASAFNSQSFVCGSLYYTEDKNIGKIEGYIAKYAEMRAIYNKSFLGKFLNFTGLSKAGSATFDHLTTVKQGGLEINFSDEFVQIIKVYNLYKENFVKDKFDITSNKDIDAIVMIYDEAVKSEIAKNYVTELLPKASTKWSNGEKFLGLECPITGEWSEVAIDALAVFKVDNINRISSNLKAIANAIKVANNNGIIKATQQNQKVEDLLSSNNTFVKEEILVLTSTNELRENISIILNDAFEVLYRQVVGKDIEFDSNVLTTAEIAELNKNNGWNAEAQNIQDTVSQIFKVYDVVKANNDSNALLDKLQNIGASIDSARKSRLISQPFKTFITGFIAEKVNLEADIKEELLNNINTNWNDETFEFERMFKAIQDAAIVAKNISAGDGNVSLEDLSSTLKDIVSNDNMKDSIASVLEKDIIKNVVGEENADTVGVMTEVLETLVTSNKVTSDTIDNDIAAGEQIVNIVNNVKNNDGNLNLGETAEEKQASADKIVEDLTSSAGVMDLLKDSAESTEGSAITDFTKDVSTEDKAVLAESIDKLDNSDPNKQTLKKLFGLA